MRVITGKFKGRRLTGPKGPDVRPTSDRLKESIFDILGGDIRDSIFADVFAGTGGVGIEALSRGASQVLFIESSRDSVRVIRRNLDICGITKGYRMVAEEAFSAMRSLGRSGFTASILYFDPPYNFEPYADLLKVAFTSSFAGVSSVAIVEHFHRATVPEEGPRYQRTRVVRQGEKCLSFYRHRPPEAP
jgi:16S rRNA (guanine966-N2)-methyltransferase